MKKPKKKPVQLARSALRGVNNNQRIARLENLTAGLIAEVQKFAHSVAAQVERLDSELEKLAAVVDVLATGAHEPAGGSWAGRYTEEQLAVLREYAGEPPDVQPGE